MNWGFSYIGLIFLFLLMIPNLLWTKHKPKDYELYVKNENKILLILERIGEVLFSTIVLIFTDFNINEISFWLIWLLIAILMMILYECYWISYFKSDKTMEAFYRDFLGIPVAGASLPIIAFIFLAIYGKNVLLLIATIIFGIAHIGIHFNHQKEII